MRQPGHRGLREVILTAEKAGDVGLRCGKHTQSERLAFDQRATGSHSRSLAEECTLESATGTSPFARGGTFWGLSVLPGMGIVITVTSETLLHLED